MAQILSGFGAEGSGRQAVPRVTRREPIHGGSTAASMPLTVTSGTACLPDPHGSVIYLRLEPLPFMPSLISLFASFNLRLSQPDNCCPTTQLNWIH